MPEVLRDYQQRDAEFLTQRFAAALFNEQRTGKTPTVLQAIRCKGFQKVLVVAPASALYQWRDEYIRWLEAPCIVCHGTATQRKKVIADWTHGLIISYDTLKLIDRGNKTTGELHNILSQNPEAVILDEAHRIRNRKTATAKAAFALSKIPFRVALTGTPTPNKPEEIWSILHFLYPKSFKSYWNFIYEYFYTSQESNPLTGQTYINILGLNDRGKMMMPKILNRISTNRKRKDVMTWLPDKDYIYVNLPITKEQARYLDELLEMWETEDVVTQGVLDRLIRYRQICLDPGLLDLKGSSPKTEWLMQYLKDYPERPTIVFSKFTSYLVHLYNTRLKDKAELIIGATPVQRRREICNAFQNGELNLMLINIDAGKESLTLDRCEAIIFTDRYPPVGDISQAEDRFVSSTPDKADKPHLIYILSIKDSYDEEINKLIAARYTETDIINNYRNYVRKKE